MQRIERYGVIALVFLLVTILAVSLWGEGKDPRKQAEEGLERVAEAPVPDLPVARTSPIMKRGARDRALPTSDNSQASNAVPRDRDHSRNPNVLEPERKQSGQRRGNRALPTPGTTPVVAQQPQRTPQVLAQTPTDYVPVRPVERRTQAAAGGAKTCVVGAGETLSQISQRELGTYKRWPEIARLNGDLDPNKLHKGMVLALPPRDAEQAARVVAAATAPAPAAEEPSRQAPEQGAARTYRVKKGDVLGVIAQRELGTSKRWKEIAKLNPKVDPDRLIVGARLVLPGAAPTPRPAELGVQVAVAQTSVPTGGWSGASAGGKVR